MFLKKPLYRIYQFIISCFLRIKPVGRQHLLTGINCLLDVPAILKQQNISQIEIITTPGFIRRKTLEPICNILKLNNIQYCIYSDVSPDPNIECIEKALNLFKLNYCSAILAIGGGSVLDCAKIVAARAVKPKQPVARMSGMLKIHKKLPMLIAVPTTAGTGSEVTLAAVITDEKNHYKHCIMDYCLVPTYAVLDPMLLTSLPAPITAYSGMDALTHALEAYINIFSTEKINKYAEDAIVLIWDHLYSSYQDGGNVTERQKMLLGSYYAGIAFTNGYVGYVHAFAHAVGGLYGIEHGKAIAIILPVILESYGKVIYNKLSRLADLVGIIGASDEIKAKKFIQSIKEMNQAMKIPDYIDELKQSDYIQIVKRIEKEANPTYPVPVIYDKRTLIKILEKLRNS